MFRVSFDRPYGKFPMIFEAPQSIGSGEFLLWEFPLCYWLERFGYDVTYCSNSDVLSPARSARAQRCFSASGHDEYWDLRQFEALRQAVRDGMSILFLSANTAYMMSPFTPASDGRANRVITRTGPFGPLSEAERNHLCPGAGSVRLGRPGRGATDRRADHVPFNGCGDWICTRPDHWIFAGTGMKRGRPHSGPGRLGISRRTGRHSGARDRGRGIGPFQCPVCSSRRQTAWQPLWALDGDDLSRAQEKLCLQCLYHLVGARPRHASRPYASLVARVAPARPR